MVSFPVLIGLGSIILFAETVTARCLYTHRDPICKVEGHLPFQLNCDFPAKWFKVENVIERDSNGSWTKVAAAKEIADNRCKDSRIVKQGGGSQCTVDNLPGLSAADEVKVEFYCWEVDPDLLGGFGKRNKMYRQLKTKYFNEEGVSETDE